jgi:hypothetical protein
MSIIVETPFQNFTGLDGKPLTNGKVYIGQVGTDPTVFANQIPVFWDEALTIPASQPLTTSAGYIVRFGTPARIWVATDYSMSVKNSSGVLVYYVSKFGAVDIESEILALLGANDGASLVGSAAWYADAIIGFDATKVPDGATVNFSGRTVKGDPGGGVFTYFKTSTQTADNGLVYAPTGGGRLVRNGWTVFGFNGTIFPEWFGAKGDRTTDDKPALQAASNAAQAFPCGGVVELGSGRAYAVGSTWAIPKIPDKSIAIKGNHAVILNLSSFDGTMFYFGQAANTGGFPISMENIDFRASTPNANGMILEWASSSVLKEVRFFGGANGVYLRNTYALVLDKPGFFGQTTAGIQSETYAHHLTLIAPQFSDCTRGIYFQQEAYNLVVIAPDGEGGQEFMELARGGSAVSIAGGYIEGYTSQPFVFGMPVVGFSMTGVWFGFNAPQTWTNISGGVMSNNIHWDQSQTIGVSCIDLDIGTNSYIGTANKIYSPFAAPALINGFANFGFGYSSAGYRKDQTGTIHFIGMVAAAADATAFVLPVGYRPGSILRFPVLGDSGIGIGAVTIDTSGSVTVIRASGRADLSSISSRHSFCKALFSKR